MALITKTKKKKKTKKQQLKKKGRLFKQSLDSVYDSRRLTHV